MRTLKKGILSLLLGLLMLSLTACGQDKPDYEQLKTDIVGIWCDINGPEYYENDEGAYYQIYEFTSDGTLAYHMIFQNVVYYYDYQYELRDNYLSIDDAMCKVSMENDILTMTNDNGDTKYRRMSMEEVCNFGVVYLDADNYNKQIEYTDFFTINWPESVLAELPSSDVEAPASENSDTAAQETVSETSAS